MAEPGQSMDYRGEQAAAKNFTHNDLKCGRVLTDIQLCGALYAVQIVKGVSQQYNT